MLCTSISRKQISLEAVIIHRQHGPGIILNLCIESGVRKSWDDLWGFGVQILGLEIRGGLAKLSVMTPVGGRILMNVLDHAIEGQGL